MARRAFTILRPLTEFDEIVVALLRFTDAPVSVVEFCEACGAAPRHVVAALEELERRNMVRRLAALPEAAWVACKGAMCC